MLSIIIPCWGEEPYLKTLLSELERKIDFPYEVLIQTEKGLGYAVMCGVIRAKGDVICVLDSDGSHPATSIPFMYQYIGEYDIVVGSRYRGGLTQDSVRRQIISRVYCLTAQAMFRLNVKDNMSGFIVAKRQVFLDYPIQCRGFKFGLELLVASRHRYHATEYPICFACRKAGKSKASPLQAVNTLRFMYQLLKDNLK
jgi:dolichol-phosphate mannosyltransferase